VTPAIEAGLTNHTWEPAKLLAQGIPQGGSQSLHKVGYLDAERIRYRAHCAQGNIPLTSFYRADVGAVNSRSVGENVLRPTLLRPQSPHGFPKPLLILHKEQCGCTLRLCLLDICRPYLCSK